MRLSRVLNEVMGERKRLLREARRHGELMGDSALRPINDEDVLRATGLGRTFLQHLKQGKGMTLSEYVGIMQWLLSECDTEADRLYILSLADTLLFCGTSEASRLPQAPFERPLPKLIANMRHRDADRYYDIGRKAGRYEAMAERDR